MIVRRNEPQTLRKHKKHKWSIKKWFKNKFKNKFEFAKLVIQWKSHAKRGMDPIGILHESSLACFAEQPPLMEGHDRGAVMSRSVAEGLQIAGILDGTFIGTTVRTDSMDRRIADDQVFVIGQLLET